MMIRNAGGRVFDVIRTLTTLRAIGNPGTIVVMHHTGTLEPSIEWLCVRIIIKSLSDCGLTHWFDDDVKKNLLEVAPEHKEEIEKMNFGEIKNP
jgi:carbonic anhydrase